MAVSYRQHDGPRMSDRDRMIVKALRLYYERDLTQAEVARRLRCSRAKVSKLLAEGRATSDDDLRERMSGNICRCGAYPNILASIKAARDGGKAG